MRSTQQATLVIVVVGLAVMAIPGHAQPDAQSEREAMYERYLEFPSYVKGGSIEPHWLAGGSSFWYAEGAPDNTIIYKVDPKANTKTPLFDTARLRQALTALLGHEPPNKRLPFEEFTFVDESETAVKFTVEDKEFVLRLDAYTIKRVPSVSKAEKSRTIPQSFPRQYNWGDLIEEASPDGRWFARLKDNNLWLRSAIDGRRMQLTTDGIEDYAYVMFGAQWSPEGGLRWAWWSPTSSKLAVKKMDYRKVYKRPIVHWLKPREEVEWVPSPRAGGAIPQTELFILDILSKGKVRVDTGQEPDHSISVLGWWPDGSELLFSRTDRRNKTLDVLAANPTTGSTRVILTETQKTFCLWEGRGVFFFTKLEQEKRFLWMSDRDGWNHLYLYDGDGDFVRLTEGPFPVVNPPEGGVVAVDENEGWVYFTAHGDQKRPYDAHLYRVNFEGKGFKRLTEAPGHHDIRFTPSKQFFLDTHSTVSRPPVVELRRADGTLLRTLSTANLETLRQLKWRPPEEFVVKAADGKTDLYGVLYKPYDFDPSKKYPVIEVIYGCPQFSEVPHSFIHPHGVGFHAEHGQALAQLGFIAFVVDGRGTPQRGKAFQDVAYRNIGRHEILDHRAALTQLAEKRSYMDLDRVGIFGTSCGGYFTVRALLVAPDFYHVGIAVAVNAAGTWESYLYEAWMDLPQLNKEGYEYGENLHLVDNLKGKLLMIIGTSDGHFKHTMKMVDALIQAGKPYDLIVLPEQGHGFTGASGTVVEESIRRYFQEHLQP
ncbi:MAG: DPP IV N-terminal domain-containing protein [Planctomycetes bacterium]|nr:DPP IV N-terminal domain-containing protein [Planctomycetota bacterium]